VTAIDCPRGIAPERTSKTDATGLAPEKSADHNSPAHDSSVREGLASLLLVADPTFRRQTPSLSAPSQNSKPISVVKSLSRGLGLKREDRPAAFAGRSESQVFALPLSGYSSCLHKRVCYPTVAYSVANRRPVGSNSNLRNRPENNLRTSGEKTVTRYCTETSRLASNVSKNRCDIIVSYDNLGSRGQHAWSSLGAEMFPSCDRVLAGRRHRPTLSNSVE
jgi:hypothetical protein